MIPSKHPKCYHPDQGLDSSAFRYQRGVETDIRQRFARAREDLQRPRFSLVAQDHRPANKAAAKLSKPAPRQAGNSG